jgi:hypothetical protein
MGKNQATAQAMRVRRVCAIAGIVMLAGVSHADTRTITVLSGTYGANCGAPGGNATGDLVRQCDGRDACRYVPDRASIGYSGRACQTDLQADWRCNGVEFHTAMLSPPANADSTLVLSCVEQNGPGH